MRTDRRRRDHARKWGSDDDPLGAGVVAVVGQRVAEQGRELDVLEDVRRALVGVHAALQQRQRRAELAGGGICAREALGEARQLHDVAARRGDRVEQEPCRLGGLPVAECEAAEAGERFGTVVPVFPGVSERALVERARRLDVVEPERDLGVDKAGVGVRLDPAPGREVVGADAQPASELAQQLDRRDALAELEPRDVRRSARVACQGALTQTGLLTSLSEPLADRVRVVVVLCLLFCHAVYSWSVRARTVPQFNTKGGPV